MPETTTPASAATAAQAPAPLRPPLTGREDMTAVAAYIAAKLHAETGPRADGSDRWQVRVRSTASAAIIYAESGLVFDVERTDNGVSPYTFACPANRQEVPGARGAEPKSVSVKLHANGDIVISKAVHAALVHAQRKADAAERGRAIATAQEVMRAALEAYATPLIAELPAPQTRGSFAAGNLASGATPRRSWQWKFDARDGDSDTGLSFAVRIDITMPSLLINAAPARAAAEFDPRQHTVNVGIGFHYATATRVMPLCDALAVVATQAKAARLLREALAPEAPEALTVSEESREAPEATH